jgi:hypothetical protein
MRASINHKYIYDMEALWNQETMKRTSCSRRWIIDHARIPWCFYALNSPLQAAIPLLVKKCSSRVPGPGQHHQNFVRRQAGIKGITDTVSPNIPRGSGPLASSCSVVWFHRCPTELLANT